MIVEMQVIDHNGEKVFEYNEDESRVLYTRLRAYREFEGGSLTVMRGDSEIAKTWDIHIHGRHGTCFMGLRGIFDDENPHVYGAPALSPQELEIGDQVVLDLPHAKDNGSFLTFIKDQYGLESALISVFGKPGKSLSMDELSDRVSASLERQEAEPEPEVLRFES